MPVVHQLPPFENVAANSRAVLPRIPQGDTYDAIIIDASGSTALLVANMNNVSINLGGKRIWDVDFGAHYDLMAQYNGFSGCAAEGFPSFWFADPMARTIVGQRIGALDTSFGYSQFQMEFNIGTATSPALTPYGLKSAPKVGAKAMFRAMLRSTLAPGSDATHTTPVPLGSNVGNLIRAIHFFTSGDELDALGVRKDGIFLWEDISQALFDWLSTHFANNKVAQSNHCAFDALLYNDQSDVVPTLRPNGAPAHFEFRVNTNSSETIEVYSDLYTEIDRL